MNELGSFDFETASEAGHAWNEATQKWEHLPGVSKSKRKGLGVVGAFAYAQHPTTRVTTFSYRLPGETTKHRWRPGQPPPILLFDALKRGAIFKAHNAIFELAIWEYVCARKYGWPSLLPFRYQLRCTMATARSKSYPGALANLSEVLELPTPKDADGVRLLDKFSVPRNPTKGDPRKWVLPPHERGPTPPDTPAKFLKVLAEDDADFGKLEGYCDTDLDAEEGAYQRIGPMPDHELNFWFVDQEINWRGIAIDRAGVRDCIAVLEQALDRYGQEFRTLTGFDVTQLQAAKGWLAAQGVHMASMDEEAIEAQLAQMAPHPPGAYYPLRRALEIRQLTGSASVKKLYAMEHQADEEDRLKNLIVHHGARTGRPTGEGPQPLNLPKAGPDLQWCPSSLCHRPFGTMHAACPWCGTPEGGKEWRSEWSGRPKLLPESAVEAVEQVLTVMSWRDLSLVEFYFGDALLCISGCVRGLFVAGPGRELIASDFTAIEAVVIAALAGEEWRLEAVRQKRDIYYAAGLGITGVSYEEYMTYKEAYGHHPDRQKKLKVAELACLTPETQVLTKRGYLVIVDVRATDELWDGEQWVTHQGVLEKGIGKVVRLDGVEMTPNHLIICDGSWKEAERLVSNEHSLHLALANGSENLPSLAKTSLGKGHVTFSYSALAGRRNIASPSRTCLKASLPDATNVLKGKVGKQSKVFGNTKAYARTNLIVDACSIGFLLAYNVVTTQKLKGFITTAVEELRFTSFFTTNAYFWLISCLCLDGTTHRLSLIEKTSIKDTSPAIFVSLQNARISTTAAPCENFKIASCSWRSVYDIAYAGPRNRFTIKTASGHLIVHNCGFAGWVGSLRAFGFDGTDEEAKNLILAWRKASPAIVELWGGQFRGAPWDPTSRSELYGFEGMAIAAIQNPGVTFDCRGIKFTVRDTPAGTPALYVRLLSGRELTYHKPSLVASTRKGARAGELQILYWTWNSNPKYGAMGWVPMQTYGGRLTENIVQATAHDVLRHAILALRAAGYPTVLHVYDEIVVEVPEGAGSVEEVERIMSTMPAWAAGWPIRASGGWRGRRYRKG